MKTTYKANGKTFATLDEVQTYAEQNGWFISDTEHITHKGNRFCLCNLKSNKLNGKRKYYPPSDSYEHYNEETDTWYNHSGQELRDPSEYDVCTEGYTPFGDE